MNSYGGFVAWVFVHPINLLMIKSKVKEPGFRYEAVPASIWLSFTLETGDSKLQPLDFLLKLESNEVELLLFLF
jgi:hypothetical protein